MAEDVGVKADEVVAADVVAEDAGVKVASAPNAQLSTKPEFNNP